MLGEPLTLSFRLSDLPPTRREATLLLLATAAPRSATLQFLPTDDGFVEATWLASPNDAMFSIFEDEIQKYAVRTASPPRDVNSSVSSSRVLHASNRRSGTTQQRPVSRSRSRSASPSHASQERSAVWAAKLADDIFLFSAKTYGIVDNYLHFGALVEAFCFARCGLSSLVKPLAADIVKYASLYQHLCPACAVLSLFADHKVPLAKLTLFCRCRLALQPFIHAVTQKCTTEDGKSHVVPRQYIPFGKAADVIRKLFGRTPAAALVRRRVLQWIEQASRSHNYSRSFDLEGHFDAMDFLRLTVLEDDEHTATPTRRARHVDANMSHPSEALFKAPTAASTQYGSANVKRSAADKQTVQNVTTGSLAARARVLLSPRDPQVPSASRMSLDLPRPSNTAALTAHPSRDVGAAAPTKQHLPTRAASHSERAYAPLEEKWPIPTKAVDVCRPKTSGGPLCSPPEEPASKSAAFNDISQASVESESVPFELFDEGGTSPATLQYYAPRPSKEKVEDNGEGVDSSSPFRAGKGNARGTKTLRSPVIESVVLENGKEGTREQPLPAPTKNPSLDAAAVAVAEALAKAANHAGSAAPATTMMDMTEDEAQLFEQIQQSLEEHNTNITGETAIQKLLRSQSS